MEQTFKVYYVKEFPIDPITDRGESGWHSMPDHTRNRYRFMDALLEHIDNTFCEPVQIIMRNDREIALTASGVVRLYALRTIRGWTHIPAIVSTLYEPEWLDTSAPITTLEQYRSYYRLEPADYGFNSDGSAFHRNYNPNPQQMLETFMVSEETKKRMLEMFEEESKL